MIPERISIEGFLSYDEQQVLQFDAAPVWLLSGPNGSGKSSVFDAITFALFGGHRAGQGDLHELINKKCNAAAVEFEFRLEGKRFRIQRTLKRNKRGGAAGTRKIDVWHPPANGDPAGTWREVPDSASQEGFNRWIQEHIGLTYETFTSSVLLMQGKADILLTAQPKERHEVLARVVGLERFEKLHLRAKQRHDTHRDQANLLQRQLEALEPVTPELLEAADQCIEATQKAQQDAETVVRRWEGIEAQALQWVKLRDELNKVQQALTHAQSMLAKEKEIESDWERLQEFRQVLPPLKRAAEHQERIAQGPVVVAQLMTRGQELDAQLRQIDQQRDAGRLARQHLEQAISTAETRQCELIADSQGLAAAVPHLGNLHRNRERLRQATSRANLATRSHEQAAALVQQRVAALVPLAQQVAREKQAREEAARLETRTETLLGEARQRQQRFDSVAGEKKCRFCGQALTPDHVEKERTQLRQDLAQATAAYQQAFQDRKKSALNEKRLIEQHAQAELSLKEAQQQTADWQRQLKEAEQATRNHAEECAQAYQEMGRSYQGRVGPAAVSDWTGTIFPTQEELDTLKRQHAKIKAELTNLDQAAKENRQQLALRQKTDKKLETDRDVLRQERERISQQLTVHETQIQESRQALDAARAELPASWQQQVAGLTSARLREFQQLADQLDRSRAEDRYRDLLQARGNAEALRNQQAELEQRRDAIPAEARCAPEELQHQLGAARQQKQECDRAVVRAQHEKQQLLERQETRGRLDEEAGEVKKQQHLWNLLTRCLSRDWLQRHLIRQAERAIVGYANAMLQRLSGGQLFLRLRNEEEGKAGSDEALRLEVYGGPAGSAPRDVAFLSGSERFRVAVSLALAIGQYASLQHRPIQSVIIDEGFGCLDPGNRQLIIQELQNLRSQLQRIVLVAHQEEFAEVFSNGFRFELRDGATLVTPLGRDAGGRRQPAVVGRQ